MKISHLFYILTIFGLIATNCKSINHTQQSITESFPASVPTYTQPRFNSLMASKFAIAKRINNKYKVGPRLRFDEYLDNNSEVYLPCWDTGTNGLVDPQGAMCEGVGNTTAQAKASCVCKKIVNDPHEDCFCKFPEALSAEKLAIQAAIDSAREVSVLAAQNGFSFTVDPMEVYLVFLAESGFDPISQNMTAGIDGYIYLGVDNISESPTQHLRSKYENWAPMSFKKWINETATIRKCVNELAQTCYSPQDFDIRNGMYAVATEYVYFKSIADKKIFAASQRHIDQLPRRGQLFWSYAYFNAGEGVKLNLSNINRFDLASSKDDNYDENLSSATYNASVRTSTFAYWQELCKNNLGVTPGLCSFDE